MPDHHVAINNRGVGLMAKGELDRAITDFDRAIADLDVVIKADPKNPNLIHECGTMRAKMGDGVGAEADFRRAEALTSGANVPVRPR